MIDTAGRIKFINITFGNMLGYSPEETYKMNIADITYSDDIEMNFIMFDSILSEKCDQFNIETRYPDLKLPAASYGESSTVENRVYF